MPSVTAASDLQMPVSQNMESGSTSIGAQRQCDVKRLSIQEIQRSLAEPIGNSANRPMPAEKAKSGPDKFSDVMKKWNAEHDHVFDTMAACNALRAKSSSASQKAWGSIIPPSKGLGTPETLLNVSEAVVSQLAPGWLSLFESDFSSMIEEIACTIMRNGWKAVLAPNIATAPCFNDIREHYQIIEPSLKRALKEYRNVKEEILAAVEAGNSSHQAISQYSAARETLMNQTDKAADVNRDYEQAAGKAWQPLQGNASTLFTKIIVAGTALTPAKVALPVIAGTSIPIAKSVDRDRADHAISELNRRFADILLDTAQNVAAKDLRPEHIDQSKLRALWQSPMQAKLALLIQVIEHEASQSDQSTPLKESLTAEAKLLEQVMNKPSLLNDLKADSRAKTLLLDDKAFFQAAVMAILQGPDLARRIGQSFCGKLLSTPSGVAAPLVDSIVTAAGESEIRKKLPPHATSSLSTHQFLSTHFTGFLDGLKTTVWQVPKKINHLAQGLHSTYRNRSVNQTMPTAHKLIADGIIESTSDTMIAIAASKHESAADAVQDSLSAFASLLSALGDAAPADKTRFQNSGKLTSTYHAEACLKDIEDAESTDQVVLLLLKHGGTKLAFHRGADGEWYNSCENGCHISHIKAKPSHIMKGIANKDTSARNVQALIANKLPDTKGKRSEEGINLSP